MEINKRLKILILGSVMGVFYTTYIFYNMHKGQLLKNDWISIIVLIAILISFYFFFKKKWESEE